MKNLQNKTIFASLFNTDYQGQVARAGDKVKIANLTNPTIRTYSQGTDLTYESVTGDEQTLEITQQKYFAFDVDDVYGKESAIDFIAGQTENAGYMLADTLDSYLAGLIKSGASINLGTSSDSKLYLSGSNGLETLAKITEKMDDAKAPESDRWCVVPNNVARLLTLELAGKLTQNSELIKTGYIGTLFGLNIYKSNNVTEILCGCRSAGTLAQVITETEEIRRQNAFATSIRGLHVYGAKVTRPTVCGCIYVTETAPTPTEETPDENED